MDYTKEMTVSTMFVNPTMAHARMRDSLPKYIPEGFRYIDYVWSDTIIKEYPDVVLSHYGWSTYQPFFAFISPKVVISELLTPQIMSYFYENDLLVLYNPALVNIALNYGINAILWPRPVDNERFFLEPQERDIDILIPSAIHDMAFVNDVVALCRRMNKVCVSMTRDIRIAGYKDYDDGYDKLRTYYNRSKYILSIVTAKKYGVNQEYTTHGFEVSYIEGTFCGATPVVIEAPTGQYLKHWYGDYAKWIREDNLLGDIEQLLLQEYTPLSQDLINKAVERYNAKKVWGDLFSAIRQIL